MITERETADTPPAPSCPRPRKEPPVMNRRLRQAVVATAALTAGLLMTACQNGTDDSSSGKSREGHREPGGGRGEGLGLQERQELQGRQRLVQERQGHLSRPGQVHRVRTGQGGPAVLGRRRHRGLRRRHHMRRGRLQGGRAVHPGPAGGGPQEGCRERRRGDEERRRDPGDRAPRRPAGHRLRFRLLRVGLRLAPPAATSRSSRASTRARASTEPGSATSPTWRRASTPSPT